MKIVLILITTVLSGCFDPNNTGVNGKLLVESRFAPWHLIAEYSPGTGTVELWRTFDKETNCYIYYANGGLAIIPVKSIVGK